MIRQAIRTVVMQVTTTAGTQLVFRTDDPYHGALLYYDDCGSDTVELAYCKLRNIYTIPPDDELWIEHEYLFDLEDVKNHARGASFLKSYDMSPVELVQGRDRYHSLACVIEGDDMAQ